MGSDAVIFNPMNANESGYCICVVLELHHGNLNLDTYSRVPLSTNLARTAPWERVLAVIRQNGMPNRMWRYNGSGISGFTRSSSEVRITTEMSPPPWNRTVRYGLLSCKKNAANWIRDRIIDQTNTEEYPCVCAIQ